VIAFEILHRVAKSAHAGEDELLRFLNNLGIGRDFDVVPESPERVLDATEIV
jgi:hypothetical protein